MGLGIVVEPGLLVGSWGLCGVKAFGFRLLRYSFRFRVEVSGLGILGPPSSSSAEGTAF